MRRRCAQTETTETRSWLFFLVDLVPNTRWRCLRWFSVFLVLVAVLLLLLPLVLVIIRTTLIRTFLALLFFGTVN